MLYESPNAKVSDPAALPGEMPPKCSAVPGSLYRLVRDSIRRSLWPATQPAGVTHAQLCRLRQSQRQYELTMNVRRSLWQ